MKKEQVTEVTELQKLQSLKYYVGSSFLISIFVVLTFTGSVFVLFLDELGLEKSRIGIILSLTPFCQVISLISAPLVERIGFKRSFFSFYALRTVVISLLLFTPLVLNASGTGAAYVWIGSIMLMFSLCRAIAESAFWPWNVEIVPNSIRGKFSAVNSIVATLGVLLAVGGAGFVIDRFEGIGRFIVLIAIGIAAGFGSLVFFGLLPGGAPHKTGISFMNSLKAVKNVAADRNYLCLMGGYGLYSLVIASILSFLPLYMNEKIGLARGPVVWLDIGMYSGSMLLCFFWGWICDRFGAKPIIMICLGGITVLPLMWFLLPRHSSVSFRLAMTVSFLLGVFNIGWLVAFTKYLYANAVPHEKRTAYLSFFYAWAGISASFGPFIGGWILEHFSGFDVKSAGLHLDQYAVFFAVIVACSALAVFVSSRLKPDSAFSTGRFIDMFIYNNPFISLSNVMRYHRAGTEDQRIRTTEKLASRGNLISADELLDALNDPSYNVRHEAVVAISKMPAESKLVEALCEVLGDTDSDLSLSAAWALGRIGSPLAVEPLRNALKSPYKLLRARSARALAMLNDTESVAWLLEQFRAEPDPALRVAYASAAASLGATELLPDILVLLRNSTSQTAKRELTLSCARMAGQEYRFIRYWRKINAEPSTNTAQMVLMIRSELNGRQLRDLELRKSIIDCAETFSRNDLETAAVQLGELGGKIEIPADLKEINCIVEHCARALMDIKAGRIEYIVLMVHTIHAGLRKAKKLS